MKVAVLAATGKAGNFIAQEALMRGHQVSAFARHAERLKNLSQALCIQKDIFALTAKDLENFDIIIDAFGEWQNFNLYRQHGEHLLSILKGNAAKFLVVGGAGSFFMDKAHTVMLMETPDFPESYKGVARAHGELLNLLRQEKNLNWVYVSPAAEFVFDAPKTGRYKIIGEEFEVNEKGESKISYADYALAMLDIAENKAIHHARVGTIGL